MFFDNCYWEYRDNISSRFSYHFGEVDITKLLWKPSPTYVCQNKENIGMMLGPYYLRTN